VPQTDRNGWNAETTPKQQGCVKGRVIEGEREREVWSGMKELGSFSVLITLLSPVSTTDGI
jgi:hypothetical protein